MAVRDSAGPGGRPSPDSPIPDISSLPLARLALLVAGLDLEHLPAVITMLEADGRRGCQELARRARRRIRRQQRERESFAAGFRLESSLWDRGYHAVAGVDEAGRGPLAGPVVAAAVVLDRDVFIPGLDDSKALTPERRKSLSLRICTEARAVAVGWAAASDIDRDNIHRASLKAMGAAVEKLAVRPDWVLVDGKFSIDSVEVKQKAVVGGDALSNSIAAASIVAKVVRDRWMAVLDRRYPGYGFRRNRGYPTPDHRDAIKRFGPTPEHRRSFRWF